MNHSLILRRLLRAGAVLALSAALAACGGDGGDDDDATPPPDNGSQPETPQPQPPATPELRCAP